MFYNVLPQAQVMLRTGLLLDVNNLHYAVQAKFGKRRLMVLEYAKALEEAGHTLTFKIAYNRQPANSCAAFMGMLEQNGFECVFGCQQAAVAIALKVADMVSHVDSLVIGSNFDEMGRVFRWAKDKGKITKCFAVNIPSAFKYVAECVEVHEGLLSAISKVAK
jgi:hypothetical protein